MSATDTLLLTTVATTKQSGSDAGYWGDPGDWIWIFIAFLVVVTLIFIH